MLLICTFSIAAAAAQPGPKPEFNALSGYEGTWRVTVGKEPPSTLANKCSALGQYFACSQTVNGAESGLLVFIASATPGHFLTQTIRPDGRATGLDQLDTAGNVWTFSSRRDEYGHTTYYRTVNTFSGKNHIHFESAHSSNNKDWTVDRSGDETKVTAGR